MWQICLIALLMQQPGTVGPTPDTAEVPKAQKTYDTGENRVELLVLYEQRFNFIEDFVPQPPKSELLLRVRLAGKDIPQLVRCGNVVFDEAVDSAGQALAEPDQYTDEFKDAMRQIPAPPTALAKNGWQLSASLKPATRTAETVKTMSGSIRCIFASETEEIIVVDPRQYTDKAVEDARLTELGITVSIPPTEGAADNPATQSEIRVKVTGETEKIKTIGFCDAWLRPIRTRPPEEQRTEDGGKLFIYQTGGMPIDDSTQMIVTVFPTLRDEQIKFEFKDVKLP
ncbi:MAG: hypothetical protein JXO22_15355 [Phycisphaerae bacterium]|nr:hypothetical protein [Phycisphaerae bacterium]